MKMNIKQQENFMRRKEKERRKEKMIKFKINNHTWRIEEKTGEELLKLYGKENATFVFGFTNNIIQAIYINEELGSEQKVITLKHELMHCYMWETGFYYVDDFNEEVICDLVSRSNDFINEVVEKWKKENK